MRISIYPLILAAFDLAAIVSAAPFATTTTSNNNILVLSAREANSSSIPLFNETISLPYVFTLDAFLFSDPTNFLPFGFPQPKVNVLGQLDSKSKFVLKDGKLVIRIKRKTSNLEVGAPALRQGVVLLPKGQGVPVRAIIGGFEGEVKQTVIEVDDEKVLADFAVARGFVSGGPLALADRRPFVNPGLVKFRVTPVY